MVRETNVYIPGEWGYVVLDTESQGYARFCPIEIALARFAPDGTLLDTYSTLVRPRAWHVARVVTEMTGITTQMVRDAPTPREIMGNVRDFIGDSVIVGHAVMGNDVPIIDHFCMKLYRRRLDNLCVDTLYWAKTLFPDLGRYNLKALAEHFGVESDTYHRALADCLTTSRLYQRLLERARSLSSSRRADLLCAFDKRLEDIRKKAAAAKVKPRAARPKRKEKNVAAGEGGA